MFPKLLILFVVETLSNTTVKLFVVHLFDPLLESVVLALKVAQEVLVELDLVPIGFYQVFRFRRLLKFGATIRTLCLTQKNERSFS